MPTGYRKDGTKLGFKKGNIPWSKGKSDVFSKETLKKIGDASIGRKKSQETKDKIGLANSGESNGNWAGKYVGMNGLHAWIQRRKPKPYFCEFCKKVPPRDLANISGKYMRDINDYEWLCRRCHMTKDGRLKQISTMNKKGGDL